MMNEIVYTTNDKSIEVKLSYIVKRKLKVYPTGKSWPKHTQCLIYVNGLLNSFGTVIKHNADDDNQKYAYMIATKKALQNSDVNLKFIRSKIWKLVHEELETNGNM